MTLIDRRGRSSRLTEAGETLYARARELFGVERAAERELRELRGLKRGVLRIAASTTIATYMLPPCLADFTAAHPGVRIQVVECQHPRRRSACCSSYGWMSRSSRDRCPMRASTSFPGATMSWW